MYYWVKHLRGHQQFGKVPVQCVVPMLLTKLFAVKKPLNGSTLSARALLLEYTIEFRSLATESR